MYPLLTILSWITVAGKIRDRESRRTVASPCHKSCTKMPDYLAQIPSSSSEYNLSRLSTHCPTPIISLSPTLISGGTEYPLHTHDLHTAGLWCELKFYFSNRADSTAYLRKFDKPHHTHTRLSHHIGRQLQRTSSKQIATQIRELRHFVDHGHRTKELYIYCTTF